MTTVNATSVSTSPPLSARDQRLNQRVLIFLVLVTLARSLAVLLSPLGLGVDEAQYWLWSQQFDFGYYTKPPLTSWIIGVSHAIFGHEVWAVRLPAAWMHLATALILGRAASWFYNPAAGRWAAILWLLLPATSLGSFVISTDTPLLLLWSIAVLGIAGAQTGRMSCRRGLVIAGAAIGAGMLAKYAAIYGVVGVTLFVIWNRIFVRNQISSDQNFITLADLGAFLGMAVLLASPNLGWNLINDFTTVRHLGDNANLAQQSHNLGNIATFFGAQFAVAGPAAFALMMLVLLPLGANTAHGSLHLSARALALCLSLPVMAAMMVQAYLSEANANWAITALPMLTVWLAGWLASPGGLRWGLLATAINGGIAMVFLIGSAAGHLGAMTPKSDPLRHLRAWPDLAADISPVIDAHNASMIIADRRATAALLSWHFYDQPIAIRVHDEDGVPSNHFEQNLAWQPRSGRAIIGVDGRSKPPSLTGVIWQDNPVLSSHKISQRKSRDLYIYRGTEE